MLTCIVPSDQPTPTRAYHHGDLRDALIDAARVVLESGETVSLRAVAREVGVSTAAPYRHFANLESLESALAVSGLRELMDVLSEQGKPASPADVVELAVAYVRFAMQHPQLFRLMFGQPCNDRDDARVQAAGMLHEFLAEVMRTVYPTSDPVAASTAGWSLAHGLAFLHLDGKLSADHPATIDGRIRSAFAAGFHPETQER